MKNKYFNTNYIRSMSINSKPYVLTAQQYLINIDAIIGLFKKVKKLIEKNKFLCIM